MNKYDSIQLNFYHILLRHLTRSLHSFIFALSSLAVLIGGGRCTENRADIVFRVWDCEIFDKVGEWGNIHR